MLFAPPKNMDEFEELDSLFEDHFSCINKHNRQRITRVLPDLDENIANQDEILDNRARLFVDQQNGISDDEDVDELQDDDENDRDMQEETSDTNEPQIQDRIRNGCGCSWNCFTLFTEEEIVTNIFNVREMEKTEKEMLMMGSFQSAGKDKKRSRYGERKRIKMTYCYRGEKVCRTAFLLIFDTGKKTLERILKHYHQNGAVPRSHGNTGRKPKHALKYEDAERIVRYLTNFADENGYPQPAAPRGRDDLPPIYLPASTTKRQVHKSYESSCGEMAVRVVKYSSFLAIWKQCCPHVRIAVPESDVCAKCETIRKDVADSVTDEEKLEASTALQHHILKVKSERELYKEWISRAKTEMRGMHLPDNPVPPMSTDLKNIHYTFDFAQNVSLPHHARQMGPMYFLTPRKVQIFGFRFDGLSEQLNFLIDENQTMQTDGKEIHGPNAVISMIDFALTKYGFGEQECGFHADNCGGQNKNRYMLAYFAWRVMVGLHDTIYYMMQVAGHCRCLIDAGFAHAKRLYRRSDCDSLQQIAEVFRRSSQSNMAVLFNNEPTWVWRDWKEFLGQHFTTLHGIQQFQQFRFSRQYPGIVFAKKSNEDPEIAITLLRNADHRFNNSQRPTVVQPAGLSNERARYLYKTVRPYVRGPYRDFTCPEPEE